MPKYTITNRSNSTIVLPVSPSVKIGPHGQAVVVADAHDMASSTMVAMVNKGLVTVAIANDPDTPDVLEGATVGSSNAVNGNTAYKGDALINMYVELFGSDATGDGSPAKPFATPQRALDEMPNGFDNIWVVNIGKGSFTYPLQNRTLGSSAWATIIITGDSSDVAVSLPSGLSMSPVTGTVAQHTDNTVGAHAGFDGTTHWIMSDYGIYKSGGMVLPSASGEVNLLHYNGAGGASFTAVVAYTTTLTLATFSSVGGSALSSNASRIYLSGCRIETNAGGSKIQNSQILGCYVVEDAFLENAVANVTFAKNVIIEGNTIFGQLKESNVIGAVEARGSGFISRCLLGGPVSLGYKYAAPATIAILACDLASGGAITVQAGSTVFFDEGLSTAAANTSILTLKERSMAKRNGGACLTVALNGRAVDVTEGSQAYDMETLFSAVTNSATPGDEIKVGAAAVQTFASLPATDAVELCRAT